MTPPQAFATAKAQCSAPMLGGNAALLTDKKHPAGYARRLWGRLQLARRAVWMAALLATLLAGTRCAPATPVADARRMLRSSRTEQAAAALRAHLLRVPADVEARKLLIRVDGALHDLPAARADRDALRASLGAKSIEPELEYARACELAKEFDAALASYDAAAALAPLDPRGALEGGERAAKWGEWAAAESRLSAAVQRGAQQGQVWHLLGATRAKLGQLEGAQAAYRAGLAAGGPSAFRNKLGLATLALVRKDAAQIIALYTELLAEQPTFVAGMLGLAYGQALLRRVAAVEATLARAAALGAAPSYCARLRELAARSDGAPDSADHVPAGEAAPDEP